MKNNSKSGSKRKEMHITFRLYGSDAEQVEQAMKEQGKSEEDRNKFARKAFLDSLSAESTPDKLKLNPEEQQVLDALQIQISDLVSVIGNAVNRFNDSQRLVTNALSEVAERLQKLEAK